VKRTVHFERLPTVSAPGPGVDEPPTKSTPILSVPFHGTVTITNAKRQDDNSIMCYFQGVFCCRTTVYHSLLALRGSESERHEADAYNRGWFLKGDKVKP
jgi:hypothetical protein